ncbi:MAG: S-layer homology domain-containing protein [Eubacteriales bacterium]|nr:S-layer homology domain-containing protein [Eubacteriales bacterium]
MTNVKNNMLKRGSCVLLMLAMLLSFLPVDAFATNGGALSAPPSSATFTYDESSSCYQLVFSEQNSAYTNALGFPSNNPEIIVNGVTYSENSLFFTGDSSNYKVGYNRNIQLGTAAFTQDVVECVIRVNGYDDLTLQLNRTSYAATVVEKVDLAFDAFYKAVGLNNDVAVDTVTSATTQKSQGYANTYFDAENPTISGGTDVLGVTIPVETEGTTLAGTHVKQNADGSYTLVAETKTTNDVEATISSNTAWGDYQINLSDSTNGKAPADVYGVYLTTSDGTQYALRQGENLWTPRNIYEFAWSTGVTTEEPHGSALHSNHYKSMEGKTISSITYITTTGKETYNLKEGLYVAPHYTGSISALLTDTNKVKLYGLPSDMGSATVTVTTGGRNADVLATNAQIADDNTVTLEKELTEGKTYTVQVNNETYATLSATLITPDADGDIYGITAVPFNDFYASINNGDGLAQNDTNVDVVTSATTSKVRRFGNVALETETPTVEGGTDVTGVLIPVKMKLADAANISGVVANPAVYLTKNADGGYVMNGNVTTTDNVEATITSNTAWGDYMVALSDKTNGKASANVYGVYLTTTDGMQYALRQGENMWNMNNIYEFAWSTGVTTTEPHGCTLNSDHYKSMEGKTISSIIYITTSGIETYNLANGLTVAPHFGEYTASVVKGTTTMTLSGLPSDLENTKVTVSTGRPATYLAQNASIVNGKVTLTSAPDADKTYTVVVESDNYAARKTTLVLKNSGSVVTPSNPSTPVDPTPASRFTDVPADAWYADAVNTAAEKGLMAGVGNNKFDPNGIVERCQVAQIIWNMAGSPAVTGTTPFVDVASNAWYTQAVVWAYQNQVVAGTSATTFAPAQSVTRQDFACMLYRYAGSPKTVTDLSKFTDANAISAYAQDAVQWAVSKGIISGNDLSQLNPKGYLTRAEAASIIVRYVG